MSFHQGWLFSNSLVFNLRRKRVEQLITNNIKKNNAILYVLLLKPHETYHNLSSGFCNPCCVWDLCVILFPIILVKEKSYTLHYMGLQFIFWTKTQDLITPPSGWQTADWEPSLVFFTKSCTQEGPHVLLDKPQAAMAMAYVNHI